MEEKFEEGKNSSNGIIILVVLLILVIIGMGGYICYDKFVAKSEFSTNINESNKSNKSNSEELDLSDSRFSNLYDAFDIFAYNNDLNHNNIKNNQLSFIALRDLKESDITKTSEQTQLGSYYYTLNLSTVEANVKKYLGSDYQFEPTHLVKQSVAVSFNPDNVGNGLQVIEYNSETKTYKVTFGGIGSGVYGPSINVTTQEKSKAVLKDDTITLETKAIYYTSKDIADGSGIITSVTYDFYSDRAKTNKVDTRTYNVGEIDKNTGLLSIYGINVNASEFSKYSTIVYTFKLDSNTGNYYFVSAITK